MNTMLFLAIIDKNIKDNEEKTDEYKQIKNLIEKQKIKLIPPMQKLK